MKKFIQISLILNMLLLTCSVASAQEYEDFMLTFRHPTVGAYYVSAIYQDGEVYLPVSELFSLLYIYHEPSEQPYSLKGYFPAERAYEIVPTARRIQIGKEAHLLSSAEILIGDMDVYLLPDIYKKYFGLEFIVNMSALNLSLQSNFPLPIEEKRKSESMRNELNNQTDLDNYPLIYPLERKSFRAGLLDYNLNYGTDGISHTFDQQLTGGIEILGGDMQLNYQGQYTGETYSGRFDGLRYRYVMENNPWITSFQGGKLSTTSLDSRSIIGVSVTNDPIMPRRLFDTYAIEGSTEADSDVELYINNMLVDYTKADELGYYRFNYPINFGTARISIRIFTPGGQIIVEEKQLDIPFTFLPEGEFAYNIQAGAVENSFDTLPDGTAIAHADIAYGIIDGLTAKVGMDYNGINSNPNLYGTISTRLFQQYLLSLDIDPARFTRINGSVNYAGNSSINLSYTAFNTDYSLAGNNISSFNANVFFPLWIGNNQSGFRIGLDHDVRQQDLRVTSYRIDMNTRIGRTNWRLNYRERLSQNSEGLELWDNSLATLVSSYTLPNRKALPALLRGLLLRAQAEFAVRDNQWVKAGLQLSKSISRRTRFQIESYYDFVGQGVMIKGLLTFDLRQTRATTEYTQTANNQVVRQNLSGSIGLDSQRQRVITGNRYQVGQSGASVMFFIDENNSGQYDKGEQKVAVKALRVKQGGQVTLGSDSVLRISQLQSYWTYEAEVLVNLLPDPTLAPSETNFSFVANPNNYKRIDIPLYRTGIIEGSVWLIEGEDSTGLSGMRLKLEGRFGQLNENLRTFADGSFYTYSLLPGSYTIIPDPLQLEFLGAKAIPEKITFKVDAVSEGDYIEDLNFRIVKTGQTKINLEENQNQVARKALRYFIMAQNAFYNHDYNTAENYIDQSIKTIEIDHALALKGTISFVMGKRDEATKYWIMANKKNPEIQIPDIQLLEKLFIKKR